MSSNDLSAAPPQRIDPLSLDPNIRLFGAVNEVMLAKLLDTLAGLKPDDPAVLELTTEGGDADIGRRIALEFRLAAQRGRQTFFIGKTNVMSAGITIMSCFKPEHRFLDAGCELLIHERRLEKTIQVSGPLRSNLQIAHDLVELLESGRRLEQAGFRDLVRGTKISFEDLDRKVSRANWYLSAKEALDLGLVAAIF